MKKKYILMAILAFTAASAAKKAILICIRWIQHRLQHFTKQMRK
jgi:hypothetical protein